MPIHCPITISCLGAEEFEALDYRVMGHAYASQNDLGRLCDESAYEADLKARLVASGFSAVHTQIPVTLSHSDFSKTYYLDMIADDALYELKAAKTLTSEHEAQLLNYIFLMGLRRGKLLNFHPPKVQGRIVATSLNHDERRRITPVTGRWQDLTSACETLRQTMCDLLGDWGAFLDIALYQEAILHFLGGAVKIEQSVRLTRGGLDLGTQRLLVYTPGLAFRLTAFTQTQDYIESQLRRLLALTGLKALQWINLNHTQIEFTTLI